MAYASIQGRAFPKRGAAAICDRCGFVYSHVDLQWQHDYRGPIVQNLRILVCRHCLDEINSQLRSIVLPADPTPIINSRVQDFEISETNYRATSQPTLYDPLTGIPLPTTTLRITEDSENRTINPFGRPVGFNQNAVMPLFGVTHYGVPLQLLSVTSNGTATVTVTCSAVHGLTTDKQVSIAGLAIAAANGFYSVRVTTATAFTYETYGSIAAMALLTPTARIITALAGLPLGYQRIPKIDGPPLTLPDVPGAVCLFELEDDSGVFLLEDGTQSLQLELCAVVPPPVVTDLFELENATGQVLLENGIDFLKLESGT